MSSDAFWRKPEEPGSVVSKLTCLVPASALAASLVLRFWFWWSRTYCHDDFMILSWAWLRSRGATPCVDTALSLYTPLAEALAPFFRLFPDSFVPIDVALLVILLATSAVLWIAYRVGRRLGASVPAALTSVALASWEPDVVRRIADIRNDPFAVLAFLSSVSATVAGASGAWVGALLGISLLFSLKYALAGPLLALVLLYRDRSRVPLRSVARFGLSCALVVSLFALYRFAVDGKSALQPWKSHLATGGVRAGSAFFVRSLTEAPLTFGLILMGLAGWSLARWRGEADAASGFAYAFASLSFVLLYILVNPFFFAYNLLMVMTLLAPVASGLERLWPEALRRRWPGALLLAAAVSAAVWEGRPAVASVSTSTNERQRSVLRWLWEATDRNERVFDNNGMHLFRTGIYHWYTYAGELPDYLAGRSFSFEKELRTDPVKLVIESDRLHWLNARDSMFLASHFVPLDSCILTPGAHVGLGALARGPVDIEIIVSGTYRVSSVVPGMKVDGAPATNLVSLSAGLHRIEAMPTLTSASEITFGYTTPRRDAAALPCPSPGPLFLDFY